MELVKIVVFVPKTHANIVREAIGRVGGGTFGNYSFASFSVKGVGRFKPEERARPAIGTIGKLEKVEEERIEITCRKDLLQEVIAAVKNVHPYEEVVIDIYPLLQSMLN